MKCCAQFPSMKMKVSRLLRKLRSKIFIIYKFIVANLYITVKQETFLLFIHHVTQLGTGEGDYSILPFSLLVIE